MEEGDKSRRRRAGKTPEGQRKKTTPTKRPTELVVAVAVKVVPQGYSEGKRAASASSSFFAAAKSAERAAAVERQKSHETVTGLATK